MSEFLIRAVAADLAVDGRTIVGLAVPFGKVAEVSDNGRTSYREGFRRGSFARTIAERGDRVRAHVNHQALKLPIGKAVHLVELADGLESHLRVSQTAEGNDVLALVRDGVLSGLSVGFRPVRQATEAGVVWRHEVALREISVVADGAYDDARIAGVRALLLPAPTPRLAAARRRLELLELEINP